MKIVKDQFDTLPPNTMIGDKIHSSSELTTTAPTTEHWFTVITRYSLLLPN